MITEIKVMDLEDNDPDTLRKIIERSLVNKGLFLPFEFSLRNNVRNKIRITRSEGFKNNAPFYSSDLSAGNVFNTGQFLYLQFPSQDDFVIGAMKGSLALSAAFSLLVLGTFYGTVRQMLRQKKLGEMRNDFMNNMTHELKTPIATIALAIDAIKNPQVKNNGQKFSEYTRILKEENHKLNRHVERVLQLSLLEKGKLAIHKTPVDLVQLIRDSIDHHKLQIGGLGASVELDAAPPEIEFNGDALHLASVFNNLLDNSLKYCGEHCRVAIAIKKEHGIIVITFKDNGIGIAREQLEKIFEKFYRVQGGDLHDIKGFGLGLSYVRWVVEAHGGTITAGSEPGRGSAFTIKLTGHA
jgi:two-component system phosphate regulon sensor histidine kinase PhoR